MKKPVVILGLSLVLSACGQSQIATQPTHISTSPQPVNQEYSVSQSRIIGSNEMIKVKKDGSNVEGNLRGYLDAFGIISIGGGVCTGTHIGNGYVLTAGHCILPEGQEGVRMNQECGNISMYWGYRGSPETGAPKPLVNMVSQCAKVIYAELNNKPGKESKDFAVLKMNSAPSAFIRLSTSGTRASNGTKLTIFGYPQGRPLEWSQYCKMDSLQGEPARFAHVCDTEPGNSGSTILAINSSGVPYVVGIHDAGTDSFNIGTHLADAMMTMKSKINFNLITATSSL